MLLGIYITFCARFAYFFQTSWQANGRQKLLTKPWLTDAEKQEDIYNIQPDMRMLLRFVTSFEIEKKSRVFSDVSAFWTPLYIELQS